MAGKPKGSKSLFKYLNISTLNIVLSGTVRFTQPGAFNDPFEMLPELVTHHDTRTDLAIAFDLGAPRRSPPVGEISAVPEGSEASDYGSRKILAELNQKIGMLCLSRTPNSLLMWSHYADQYAGAVIEFDGSHEFFSNSINMEYRKTRLRKDITSYVENGLPIPIAELCVKPYAWRYEREVRIMRSLDECTDTDKSSRGFPIFVQNIPREIIKSVTMGERTPVEQQREIYQILKATEISLFLAAIGNRGYEFRRELVKMNKGNPVVSPRTAHIFSHLNNQLGEMARWMIAKHPMSELANTLA